MADWSMLPNDLLGEIALKLDTIEDFIYFSAVCHSWNDAYSIVKNQLKKKIMPWLVLPENPNNNNKRKIFSVSNNKCYQLSMPEINGARCWGSSHGWIVLQTFDKQLQLFNPLTKDRITNLPSLLETELAPKQKGTTVIYNTWFWKHYVTRVVVMKMRDHNNNEELVVALIYADEYLALARLGDQSWTFIDEGVQDVTCCGSILYFIKWDKLLYYYDIYEIGDDIDGICNFINYVTVENDYYLTSNPDQIFSFNRYYILNSVDGDIFMINRFKENIYDPIGPNYFDYSKVYHTFRFDVYKFDPLRRKLDKIRDLDNLVLFVGDNSAFSVRASPSNNYTPNCIYFTDDESHNWDMIINFGGHDMGVFHMDSEEITQYYHGGDEDVRSEFCPPFFLIPVFDIYKNEYS